MKKLLLLVLVLLAIAFVVHNRQRLFVRDPLASVTHDGVKEEGAQVYINYSNDALIENDNPPLYVMVVQHDRPVGATAEIKCLHYIVCLSDADQVPLSSVYPKAQIESMSSRTISMKDREGRESVVTLR